MADDIAEEVKEETQSTEVEVETTPEEKVTEEPVDTSTEEPQKEVSEDIPVRSNASYIIERQKRTIEKLRTKEVDEEKEEDPLVERLDRIEQIALGQADDRDLLTFYDREPDARKYDKRIKAYMQHDLYKGVAPEVIYHHVSYNDTKVAAATKRKAADLEAKQTRSAGSSVRDTRSRDVKTAEDIKRMTAAEFKEYDREQQRLARS